MQWVPPAKRSSGADIPLSEVAGYEIRYKLNANAAEVVVSLVGGGISAFRIAVPKGYNPADFTGKLKAIDTAGISSEFIPTVWINPDGDVYPISVKDIIVTCKTLSDCEYTQVVNPAKASTITINKNK